MPYLCSTGGKDEAAAFLTSKKARRKPVERVILDPRQKLRQIQGPQPKQKNKNACDGARRAKKARVGESRGEDEDGRVEEVVDAEKGLEMLQKQDPEMHTVAKMHLGMTGKLSTCWFSLNVERYLNGEKNLTPVLTGVPQLHSCPFILVRLI